MRLSFDKVRKDFPIFQSKRNKNLIYFDSASTTQKPYQVIDSINSFYKENYGNVHRGFYSLSLKSTDFFEKAREKVMNFINARFSKEVIFVRGATEAINLVAFSFGKKFINKGDEIVISEMEHHSNFVPWQVIAQEKKAKLKIIPIDNKGELRMDIYEDTLTKKTKIVALTHISNVLGTLNPVKEIIRIAHRKNIPVLIDGAQAVGHIKVDVQDLDCDFYVFSAHKMYGPTGVGVLYGKKEWLEKMPPYQKGGEMIKQVFLNRVIYNDLPWKFEAGTPDIVGVVGMGAAINYLGKIGFDKISKHNEDLLKYAEKIIGSISGLRVIGRPEKKVGVISFILEKKKVHPHDISAFLDKYNIAVRSGHHCCQPLMRRLKIPATCRVSFGIYNNKEEIDKLKIFLLKMKKFFPF